MDLLPNSPIRMEYSPSTDILSVEYPDPFLMPLVRDSLLVMAKAIHYYDIKRLLQDASGTAVGVSEEESRAMSMLLAKTRLQRLARIQPADPARERAAQSNISQMRQAGLLPYQLRTFTSREEAMEWLKGKG